MNLRSRAVFSPATTKVADDNGQGDLMDAEVQTQIELLKSQISMLESKLGFTKEALTHLIQAAEAISRHEDAVGPLNSAISFTGLVAQ